MRQLETSHPDVHKQFMAGNFVVKKSKQYFDKLSADQVLEHVNKISKTMCVWGGGGGWWGAS